MFEELVKTKDGIEKRVVANSQEELNEAVKAVKGDEAAWVPDINDPKDGNKVVVKEEDTHRYAAEQLARRKVVDNEAPQLEEKPEKVLVRKETSKK